MRIQSTNMINAGFAFCCMALSAQGAVVLTDGIVTSSIEVSDEWTTEVRLNAFDGDTNTTWNAGDPMGWIEMDLGANYSVSGFSITLAQTPSVSASHQVFVSDIPMLSDISGGTLAHTLFLGGDGATASPTFTPVVGRYVQVRSSTNGSWLALRELDILGDPVPEPSSTFLLGISICGFLSHRRRIN